MWAPTKITSCASISPASPTTKPPSASKIEIFANGQWQKWELAGASGYQTQAPPQILVGLGDANGIDLLRILWPTGVLQDEIDLPAHAASSP